MEGVRVANPFLFSSVDACLCNYPVNHVKCSLFDNLVLNYSFECKTAASAIQLPATGKI
jgi:hypothetical protein